MFLLNLDEMILNRLEIAVNGDDDSCVHKRRTAVNFARLLVSVTCIFVKTLELYASCREVWSAEYLNEREDSFGLVLFNEYPSVPGCVPEHISDAVLVARADNVVVFVEFCDLTGDSISVFLRSQ